MEEVHNLVNIGPTNPIQILNQHYFIDDFVCVLQMTLLTKIKISMLELGLHSKDRKSIRDKANISNPKVNRGCSPLTANRTPADCVQISLGPSIQYIPLRVYHTGGFSAVNVCHEHLCTDFKRLWYFQFPSGTQTCWLNGFDVGGV